MSAHDDPPRGEAPPLSPMPAESPAARRAASIPTAERADPERFVRARAHLAGALTGATVAELGADIDSARAKVNSWARPVTDRITPMRAHQIATETLAADYLELKRYQNEAGHSKPRQDDDVSAVEQVRRLHGGGYMGDPEDAPAHMTEHLGAAIIGARHTKGMNDSPFVSLAEHPERLVTSADDGTHGAKTIADKARQLHTYHVPKAFTWTPERMRHLIASDVDGYADQPIEGHDGQTHEEWLSGTPTHETEVLFHGGDLDKYRTRQERNPNLPRGRGGRRGR